MNLNFNLIIIIILINIIISSINSTKDNIKNIEKKTKVLACSYLSNIILTSIEDNDKIIKDMMKDNNLNKESETKEKVYQYMLINCYLKISNELANKVILEISKGNKDIIKEKKYLDLFDLNKEKKSINEIKSASLEIKELLKTLKEEEEFFKNNKDDPNFKKSFQEFEEKMKKNTQKNKNNQSNNIKKKKKKSGKKPYEGTKWEIVKPYNEEIFSFKNIIFNPYKFFDQIGINTFSGMIVMTLIFINSIHSLFNKKNIEENKVEKDNKIEINNINKNEEDEDEDIIEKKNNNYENDIKNEIEEDIK